MWSEKINPKAIAEEQGFLQLAFKIGQIGCVCSFFMILVSNSLTFFIFLSQGPIDYVLYGQINSVLNSISTIISILLAIGYYALLRSNISALALPYVFLSLIPLVVRWTFLISLGIDFMTYYVISSATSVIFALILSWILWTINGTVSDRKLLKNIILLTVASLVYNYLITYLLQIFIPIDSMFLFILFRAPTILIGLAQLVLVACLFEQDQVAVINDEYPQITSSEWL